MRVIQKTEHVSVHKYLIAEHRWLSQPSWMLPLGLFTVTSAESIIWPQTVLATGI